MILGEIITSEEGTKLSASLQFFCLEKIAPEENLEFSFKSFTAYKNPQNKNSMAGKTESYEKLDFSF